MTLKDRVYTALLAAITLASFYLHLTSDKIIAWLDMMFYFLPFRELPACMLREGILPLWNPYVNCGQPLLANMQSAVLYPLDMLFYVFPPALAIKAITFLAFFLMSFFMYMFMRAHKASEDGSLLSAFIFTFTYYMTIKAVELADLHVMVWLPAALYFTKKFADRGRAYDLFFAAASLAMSFLGGHIQVFMNAYLLFCAYFVYEMSCAGRKGAVKAFIIANAALWGVVMMQALPSAEFIALSKRMAPGGMGYEASAGGFMQMEQLLEMFFPFIGPYLQKSRAFLNWMGLIDIGIMAMLLSALGMAGMKEKKYGTFLAGIFAFSFFASFMGSLPFYRWIWEHSPFLQAMRYPAKINLLFFFALCAAAGHGFDLLFKGDDARLKKFAWLAAGTAAAYVLLYAGLELFKLPMTAFYKKTFVPAIKLEDFIDEVLNYDTFLKSLLWYAGVVLAACGALYAAAAKGIRGPAMRYAVLAMAMLCGVAYNRGNNSLYATVEHMLSGTKSSDFLEADPAFTRHRVLAPGILNLFDYDLKTDDIDSLFYYKRDSLFPNVPMYHRFKNADGFESLIIADFFRLKAALNALDSPWDDPAFEFLNVKYVSSAPKITGKKIKLVFTGMTRLYEHSSPAGPAYFVPDGAAPEKPGLKVGGMEVKDAGLVFLNGRDAAAVKYKRVNENSFGAVVTAKTPGTLAVSENRFPGWNAYVDGKKTRVSRVNVCQMGVKIDEGAHEVVFKYEPASFAAGSAVSFLCLLALGAAAFLRRKVQAWL